MPLHQIDEAPQDHTSLCALSATTRCHLAPPSLQLITGLQEITINHNTMVLKTISPVTNKVIIETAEATKDSVQQTLEDVQKAQKEWAKVPLQDRKDKVAKFLDLLDSKKVELGKDISEQMGRPVKFTPVEIATASLRGRTMLEYADKALAKVPVDEASRPQFNKYLTKEPLGVVLIVFPWNYPWLCLINGLVPALLAGDAVVLKPSPQTPKVADSVVELSKQFGLPVYAVHTGDNDLVASIVQNPIIQGVSFTGSVAGGLAIQKAAAGRTIPVALELGGNDAAYLRPDFDDLQSAAENIADGALFNSGQSCCSIERVYVHKDVYDKFVEHLVDVVSKYTVGDPSTEVDMGPLVSAASGERVRKDIKDAIAAGAKALVPPKDLSDLGPAFVSPVVLVDVPESSQVLADETFGPVIPVVKVASDEEAIQKINDSQYGLTASVWTKDMAKGDEVASQLNAGTVYVNRCDYPDPHLAWTGYGLSGRGVSLSPYGFDHWVKLKSHHYKSL